MRRHLFAALILSASLLTTGCRVGAAIGDSLPPSEAYVDELHAAQDTAIAQARQDADAAIAKAAHEAEASISALREHVDQADVKLRGHADEGLATLRENLTRAEQAQDAAYKRAVAEGRTQAEAIAAGVLAKLEDLRTGSNAAAASAAAKAQEALDAATAKAKIAQDEAVRLAGERLAAAEAAQAEARKEQVKAIAEARANAEKAAQDALRALEETPNDLEDVGKLGGGMLVTLLLSYLGLRRYDSKPFLDANGNPVSESDLVKVARAQLAAAAAPKS